MSSSTRATERAAVAGCSDRRTIGESEPGVREALATLRRRVPQCEPLKALPDVHPARIPRHIAIIMDGNGRWAKERGFPRIFGHRNGAAAVRQITEHCVALGVEVLTLYSFSMENWKRPADEVRGLMQLCMAYLDGEEAALVAQNIRFRTIGRRDGLPDEVVGALDRVKAATASCTGMTLCLAINYGSRAEIADAARELATLAARGQIDPATIDEAALASRLGTAGLPDPDLLIRTAGESRVSNYLLWQISYAEIHVSPVLWPDFGRDQLNDAVRDFASRSRRFGGLESA